jgi:hypothetical protein
MHDRHNVEKPLMVFSSPSFWRERIKVRVVAWVLPSPCPLPRAGEGKSCASANFS